MKSRAFRPWLGRCLALAPVHSRLGWCTLSGKLIYRKTDGEPQAAKTRILDKSHWLPQASARNPPQELFRAIYRASRSMSTSLNIRRGKHLVGKFRVGRPPLFRCSLYTFST
jgi:hypothetical protein